MPDYIVKQGDCIESIASNHGLFWETIWNHSKNAQLKEKRKDPNILYPGDVVFVPDLSVKEESGATEQKHSFMRKGVPSRICIMLKDENDKPRAGIDYVIEIDGQMTRGETDGQGKLEQPIAPNARSGKLTVGEEKYYLKLGGMDPVSEITGIQSRLRNLGFNCEVNGQLDDKTKEAMREFQKKHDLNETEEPDEPTRQKLEQEHAS